MVWVCFHLAHGIDEAGHRHTAGTVQIKQLHSDTQRQMHIQGVEQEQEIEPVTA